MSKNFIDEHFPRKRTAEDAKLQQRLDALKATHENEVAKLDREDAAIVNRIVEMTNAGSIEKPPSSSAACF